jgi:hypothetical protein
MLVVWLQPATGVDSLCLLLTYALLLPPLPCLIVFCPCSKVYKAVVRGQQHLIAKVTHASPLQVCGPQLRDRSKGLNLETWS